MTDSALLTLQGVGKSFVHGGGHVQALRGIDLTLDDGEFVALIGASGCGKSTLLRLVAGLETADSGSIALDGAQITGPSLSCGMIFQDHRLLPWLTVTQNINLALSQSKLPAVQRKRLIDMI